MASVDVVEQLWSDCPDIVDLATDHTDDQLPLGSLSSYSDRSAWSFKA